MDIYTLIGQRHWCSHMHNQASALFGRSYTSFDWEQGFIDQLGQFHTRTEAWKIAEAAGQILYRCGGDTANGGTLYSENLY